VRILFLTDSYLDYTSDPLYVGLSRVLPKDDIIDYPYKAAFHEPDHVPWYLVPRPGRRYTREEILDLLRDRHVDLICLSSFRTEALEECKALHAQVPFPPMVFVDGSDDARIRHDVVAHYPVRAYFKRDYVWNRGKAWKDRFALAYSFRGDRALFDRTFPLPMSLVMESLPALDPAAKTIDVSYRGRASHPRRVKAVEILSSMADVRFSGGVYASPGDRKYKLKSAPYQRIWTKLFDNAPAAPGDQLRKEHPTSYYGEIAASKIAVALRGGGRTSLRYFEIAAMGALLLSDAPETLIPNDFVDRRHAVYCRPDLRDLPALVRHYLREDAEREVMISEARAHLLKYHTCERRAEYFLNVCARTI
jgi:glycosyl transferase family 1